MYKEKINASVAKTKVHTNNKKRGVNNIERVPRASYHARLASEMAKDTSTRNLCCAALFGETIKSLCNIVSGFDGILNLIAVSESCLLAW